MTKLTEVPKVSPKPDPRRAIEEGEGVLRLAPLLGAEVVPHPRETAEAASGRLLRAGRPPRGHRRAVARVHDRGRQREPRRRRGAFLRRARGRSLHASRGRAAGGRAHRRPGDLVEVQALAGLLQVLRQPRPHSLPHAPGRRAGEGGRPAGQARELLLPASAQQHGQQLPPHLLRPGAGHHEITGAPLPGGLEPRRQRHARPLQGLPAAAGNGLADPSAGAPRARIDPDLRAAVGERRLRHVPVHGRVPVRALEPAGQGRAQGEGPGPRLHRRPPRLGVQHPDALQGRLLPGAARARGLGERRLSWTLGSSTAGSTAGSSFPRGSSRSSRERR